MGGWSPKGKPSPPPNKKIKNKIQSLPIENKLCIPIILNNFCLKCHEAEKRLVQNPRIQINYCFKANLSGIKHVADVYAKIPLKPNDIPICPVHNLIN